MYTLVDIWPPRLQGSNKEISNRRWNDLAQHPSHSLTLACLHGVWAKGRVPLALRKRYAGCPRSVCCETFWGGAWYSSWTSFDSSTTCLLQQRVPYIYEVAARLAQLGCSVPRSALLLTLASCPLFVVGLQARAGTLGFS